MMGVTAVVGAQWGDEGKGKIIDELAAQVDYVVRYQGGGNAGHRVVYDGGEFAFHQVPSGVLHPKTCGVIGNGVVLDRRGCWRRWRRCVGKGSVWRGCISATGRMW